MVRAALALMLVLQASPALAQTNPTEEALDIIGPVYDGPVIICPNVAAMNAVVQAGRSSQAPKTAALRFDAAMKVQRCFEEVGRYDIMKSYGDAAVNRGIVGEVWYKLDVRNIYGQKKQALIGWIFD